VKSIAIGNPFGLDRRSRRCYPPGLSVRSATQRHRSMPLFNLLPPISRNSAVHCSLKFGRMMASIRRILSPGGEPGLQRWCRVCHSSHMQNASSRSSFIWQFKLPSLVLRCPRRRSRRHGYKLPFPERPLSTRRMPAAPPNAPSQGHHR